MKKLFVLIILIFSLGGCAAIEGAECLTQTGQQIPHIQTYPEDGAENVPPNSVVAVEHDGSMTTPHSLWVEDVNAPDQSRISGSNIEQGRQFVLVEGESFRASDPTMRQLMSAQFEEIKDIRTIAAFSENSELTATVEVGCYEPYEFRFTTGSLNDE